MKVPPYTGEVLAPWITQSHDPPKEPVPVPAMLPVPVPAILGHVP